MRVYGTSPLFDFVELVFRCRKMFIIAVILGTVISVVMVQARSTKYQTSMIVALSGQPELAGDMDRSQRQEGTGAVRKVSRFTYWLREDPRFLDEALTNARMGKSELGARYDEFRHQIDRAIADPSMPDEQFMKVTMTWSDPKQAEEILQNLYSTFSRRFVELETAKATSYRTLLERQLDEADKTANEKSQARIGYLAQHFWTQPSLLGGQLTDLEQTRSALASARLDQAEAGSRLAEVHRLLESTPKTITEGTEDVQIQEDTTKNLQTERDDLATQLRQLQAVYSAQHPKVQDLTRRMAAVDAEIQRLRSQPARTTNRQTTTRKALNPAWQELKQQEQQLTVTLRAQQRRLSELQQAASTNTARVQAMPAAEPKFEALDREYSIADTVRKQLQTALAAARIDEARDTMTAAAQMKLEIEPRSEKLDSGGKALALAGLGPILGILIAFCFALAVEALDHSLRTPIEVEKYLGKPVLAVIPRMHAPKESRKQLAGSSKTSITS